MGASLKYVTCPEMPWITASVVVLVCTACARTTVVDLAVVEPCDQNGEALDGVANYVLSSEGSTADDLVSFPATAPVGLPVGLMDPAGSGVVVTVQGFPEAANPPGSAGALPQAIGRTMPLRIVDTTTDARTIVLTGRLDSFGQTTDAEGTCTRMTADAPIPGRHGHTATFIPGANQVLIFGGAVWVDGEERLLASAELWDPSTGTFEPLEEQLPRAYHQATALPDGRVLITGGFGVVQGTLLTLQSALLFDPMTRDFTTLVLNQSRAHHTSTLLENGELVAIIGGCTSSGPGDGCSTTAAGAGNHGPSTDFERTVEIFDYSVPPGSASFSVASSGLVVPRAFHQTTAIQSAANDLLVVTGGNNSIGTICDVEVFRVESGALRRVDEANLAGFPEGRCPTRHAAVAIDGERLAAIGGQTQAPTGEPLGTGTADGFILSITIGFEQAPSLQLYQGLGRAGHLATLLADGSILVVGGSVARGAPAAEALSAAAGTGSLTSRPLARPLAVAREHAAMAVLPTNQVLLTGGHTTEAPFTTVDSTEVYFGP